MNNDIINQQHLQNDVFNASLDLLRFSSLFGTVKPMKIMVHPARYETFKKLMIDSGFDMKKRESTLPVDLLGGNLSMFGIEVVQFTWVPLTMTERVRRYVPKPKRKWSYQPSKCKMVERDVLCLIWEPDSVKTILM